MDAINSRFPAKLTAARKAAELNQTELAEAAGVSRRSISAYENGEAFPRKNVLRKMAKALGVTVTYLTDEQATDPEEGRTREDNIDLAWERFGARGAREARELLDRNSAFFAGGDIPQEDKDALFEAVMTAYLTAKQEARRKFTPRDRRSAEEET